MIGVETSLDAHGLWERCSAVEASLGRARDHETRWGPRPIDIDVLTFGDLVVAEQNLEIVARVLQDQQPPAMRSGVLRVLRRDNPKARILATDTTVSIGNLTFLFARNGKLERVLSR